MASSRLFPCLLLASAVTLTACSSGAEGPLTGSPTMSGVVGPDGEVSGAPGTQAPTSAPSPTALTPEVYRAELDGVREPVRDALSRLSDAKSLKSVRSRAEDAEEALTEAVSKLEVVAPPPEVQAEHTAYVSALRGLATELGDVRGAAEIGSVCTGSGVVTSLGRSGGLEALDEAGAALAARGDYPADVVSVKARKQSSRRLPNGRYLRSESRNGRGNFAISNGGQADAVITLVRGKKKAVSVYVRRKGKFTVPGVRDGKYRVYFTTGVDWDSKARSFTRSCTFQRFEDSFSFKTTYTASQVRWRNWRITLHRITGGNARTSTVDPDDFPS